ncbi:MAG: sigma-70 family RNA polymerase sigma factor [Methyloprofundus sp.]|nr:sigma-70 family RNA polymerase sigma factor [Methyloprofundus sp.]
MTQQSPETWLNDHGDLLYRYALLRVRSETTAEDLVQETLLAGFLSWDKFTEKSSVSTWLVGILKHKIVDHFRKHRHEVKQVQADELADDILAYQFDSEGHWQVDLVEWDTPDTQMDQKQFSKVFKLCISRLPQRMADLLFLRAIENVPMAECCDLLGFESDNQLWVTLSRTRVKLRQCLNTHWFEQG